MSETVEFSVSQFVDVFNQTVELAYSGVVIFGEVANFRVSKNRWVYFSLKDETAKVDFFCSIYVLPGPLEDGMLVKVRGQPRLHQQYGFSVLANLIMPMGSGSIKRLASLLQLKLEKEGLFAQERKRPLVYPPTTVGLIASRQSAAYSDFVKIVNQRWAGLVIDSYDVGVQGDQAIGEITQALDYFSNRANPPEVVVLIRGGGSSEDLAVFSTEQVTRAVAASRVPTLVAIGHESDVSLAELAADQRASTPSNAAELLVPDKQVVMQQLKKLTVQLKQAIEARLKDSKKDLNEAKLDLPNLVQAKLKREKQSLIEYKQLLKVLSPADVLKRGYAIIRYGDQVSSGLNLRVGDDIGVEMAKVNFAANVTSLNRG